MRNFAGTPMIFGANPWFPVDYPRTQSLNIPVISLLKQPLVPKKVACRRLHQQRVWTHTHRDMLSRNGFRHGCHARRGHEYSRGGSGGGLGGEARFGDKGWQRTTKRLISHDFLWSLVLSFDFLVFSSIFHDFLAFSPLWCHQTWENPGTQWWVFQPVM